MRKIRHDVFETNSSAVHCLVVPQEMWAKPSTLRKGRDGYIHVDYLDDIETYVETPKEKLSYLITQLYYYNGYPDNIEEIYDFKVLEESICKYTGANGVKVSQKKEPGINHQAQWDNYDHNMVDYFDYDAVISFVFGPIMVKEYRD